MAGFSEHWCRKNQKLKQNKPLKTPQALRGNVQLQVQISNCSPSKAITVTYLVSPARKAEEKSAKNGQNRYRVFRGEK